MFGLGNLKADGEGPSEWVVLPLVLLDGKGEQNIAVIFNLVVAAVLVGHDDGARGLVRTATNQILLAQRCALQCDRSTLTRDSRGRRRCASRRATRS